MKVSMMQPSFLPWQGYFELIYKSHVFIFLDDFQFSLQSYHQRNRLFINKDQTGWYTSHIDKKASFKKRLNETRFNENFPWRSKLWARIKSNYSKTPNFNTVAPFIESWLLKRYNSLAEQNIEFIKYVCQSFGWNSTFSLSSLHPSEKKRSERVVELLHTYNGTTYHCAHGSFDYMYEDGVFPLDDIEVVFQNFIPTPYKQVQSEQFVPYLSVLDALFNSSSGATAALITNGTKNWLSWQEMVSLSSSQDKKTVVYDPIDY